MEMPRTSDSGKKNLDVVEKLFTEPIRARGFFLYNTLIFKIKDRGRRSRYPWTYFMLARTNPQAFVGNVSSFSTILAMIL